MRLHREDLRELSADPEGIEGPLERALAESSPATDRVAIFTAQVGLLDGFLRPSARGP
jgi:hypothetical protein